MNTDMLIERMYRDESMVASLQAGQAEQVLNWAEGRVQECESEAEFERILNALRLLNHYVAQGGRFEHIFAMIRQESIRERTPVTLYRGDSWNGMYPTTLLY